METQPIQTTEPNAYPRPCCRPARTRYRGAARRNAAQPSAGEKRRLSQEQPRLKRDLRVLSWTNPAGLVNAAVASSATAENAPPTPTLRAPGFRKSNSSGTCAVLWAAAVAAYRNKQACNNERQMPTQAHVSRRRSAGASGLGEQHLLIQSIDSLAVSVVGRTRSYRRLNVNGLTSIVRRAEYHRTTRTSRNRESHLRAGTPRRRS